MRAWRVCEELAHGVAGAAVPGEVEAGEEEFGVGDAQAGEEAGVGDVEATGGLQLVLQ